MALSKTLRREIEVAFSRHAQPLWFRILKYIILAFIVYTFWGTALLWIILSSIFLIGWLLHFWYRSKTHVWTRSYGMWNYEENKSKL